MHCIVGLVIVYRGNKLARGDGDNVYNRVCTQQRGAAQEEVTNGYPSLA